MDNKVYRVMLVAIAIILFPIGFPITACVAMWHAVKGLEEE